MPDITDLLMYRWDFNDDFHLCLIFFGDGENVENFRFDISWSITQEPQKIIMDTLIKYLDSLIDFTWDWYFSVKKIFSILYFLVKQIN